MAIEENIPNLINIPGSLTGRHESSDTAPMGFAAFSTNMKSDIAPMGFAAFTTRMKSDVFPIPFANFTTAMKSDIPIMSTLSFSTNMKSDIAPIAVSQFNPNLKSDIAPISLPGDGRHESSNIAPITSILGANNQSSDTAPINSTLGANNQSSDTAPINSTLTGRHESSTTAPINSTLTGRHESSDTAPINSTLTGRHESSGIDSSPTTPDGRHESSDTAPINSTLTGRHESSGIDDALTTPDGRHESSAIDDALTTPDGRHESSGIDDAVTQLSGRHESSGIDDTLTSPDGRHDSSNIAPIISILTGRHESSDSPDTLSITSGIIEDLWKGSPAKGASDSQLVDGVNFVDIPNIDATGFTVNQPYLHSQFKGISGQGPKPTYDYPDNHGFGFGILNNALFSSENTPYSTPLRPDGFQIDRGDEIETSLFSRESFNGGGILGGTTKFSHKAFGGVQGQVPVMGNNPTGLGQFLEGGNTSGDIGIVDAFDDTTSGAKGFTPQMFDLGLPKTQFNGVEGTPGSLEYTYPTDVGPAGVGRLMYDVPFSDAGNPYGGQYISSLASQIPTNPAIQINKNTGAESVSFEFYKEEPDRIQFNKDNRYSDSLNSFKSDVNINGMHPGSFLGDFSARESSPTPLDKIAVLIPGNTGPTGEAAVTAEYKIVEGTPNYRTHNLSYADADVSNQRVGFERTELMDRGVYHSGKYGNFMGPQRGDKGFYFTSDLYGHNLAFDGTGDDPKKLKQYRIPHILRDMERKWNGSSDEGTPFDEGAFRGGFLTLGNRALIDVVRNTKHIIDDPIKGLLWGLKQIGLQASNPKVETEMAFLGRRTRTFNLGIGLLANMLTGPFGIRLYRHGLLNGIGEEKATYEAAVKAHNEPERFNIPGNYPGKGGGNRLIGLKEDLIISKLDTGAGGLFGLGALFGATGQKIKSLSDTLLFGPKSLYGLGGTTIRRYYSSNVHPAEKGIEKVDETNKGGGDSGLLAKYSVLSYGQIQEAAEEHSSFHDFREGAFENGTEAWKFFGAKSMDEDLGYDNVNREVLFGYHSYDTERERQDFSDNRVGLVDPFNAPDADFEQTIEDSVADLIDDQRDMIKFVIEDVQSGKFVRYRSYITDLNDTITPNWTPVNYVGRPDPVYSYTGAERNITFTLKFAAMSRQGMQGMYKKINFLYGLAYPHITPGDATVQGLVAPYIRLTIGDWLYQCPGFFSSFTTTIDNTFPWEINLESDIEVGQLPHVVSVALDFKVIGDGPHTSAVQHPDNDDVAGRHIGGGVNAETAKGTFFEDLIIPK